MTFRMSIAATLLVLYPFQSQAADWLAGVQQDCYGDVNLANGVSAYWTAKLNIESSNVAGHFFVRLDKSKLDELAASNSTADAVILDNQKAVSLRTTITRLAADYAVPAAFDTAVDLYAGLALPPVTGTLTGLAKGWIFKKLNQGSVEIAKLGMFVADGGEIDRSFFLKRRADDSAPFLGVVIEYRVKVGNEQRRFALYSCIYPVAVNVAEFATQDQLNKKIIKQKTAGTWGVWDVQDNKWDRIELRYKEQQPDFMYFDQDDIENNRVVGTIANRISLLGGPWQRKRPGGEFLTLYKNVVSK